MGNLALSSVQSLAAVNAWIGVIDSNLEGSKRTAYKKTRPLMRDGLGVGGVANLNKLEVPQVTLTVSSTTVEWEPGSIVHNGFNTSFALNGQGFFVVKDSHGRYFATRDGEFHWDKDGYLANSQGLRVLSQGQDEIKRSSFDATDNFTSGGQSLDLDRFGNKTLMVVDFGNRDGLRFSAYGSTTYEIIGELPFDISNDFSNSTDGVSFVYTDTGTVPPLAFPVSMATDQPVYTHDTVLGRLSANATTGDAFGRDTWGRLQIGNAQKTKDFSLTTDLRMTGTVFGAAAGNSWVGVNFGQKDPSHTFEDSGYQLRYFNDGRLQIYQGVLQLAAFPAGTAPSLTAPPPPNPFVRLTLDVDQSGLMTVSANNALCASFQLTSTADDLNGYLSLQNQNSTIEYDSLLVQPRHDYNTEVAGPMFMGNRNSPLAPGSTDFATAVVQQSLENSNASLTEFMPMLSMTQKMFSAISKIISVFNSLTDDSNSLIR